MPVQIGATVENDFTNPLGLLSDCHRRIEKFLGILAEVGRRAHGGNLKDDERAALATALRYFRDAAPRHTADEETSLFPRLRAARSVEAGAALATLDALHTDHEAADAAHQEVDRIGRAWLEQDSLPPELFKRFDELLSTLRSMYDRHIALEDTELFPLAGRVLGVAELEAVGREMAERRGIDPQSHTRRVLS